MIEAYFAAELEKMAATTATIAEAAKRVGYETPGFMASLKDPVGNLKRTIAHTSQLVRGSPMGAILTNPQMKVQGRVVDRAVAEGKLHPLVRDVANWTQKGQGGRILSAGPKATAKVFTARGFPVTSKEGVQALHDTSVLHEQFERSVPGKDYSPAYMLNRGHASLPKVIGKHWNMMSTLEGPGSAEVKAADFKMRGDKEYAELRAATKEVGGERAAEMVQPGQKISKAMRKRIERITRGQPQSYGPEQRAAAKLARTPVPKKQKAKEYSEWLDSLPSAAK